MTGAELVPDAEVIMTANQRLGRKVPDLMVRGLHEREILDLAPAMTCDRVHWETVEPIDMAALVAALGHEARTRQWSDGQSRVWVPEGRGHEYRDRIRAWSAEHGVEMVNARVESGVPFRDLDSVPDGLLAELLGACTAWLYSRSYAIRRKLVTEVEGIDDDDVYSLMYLFVHDHADRFDTGRSGRNGTLNLTAFMYGKLRTWPQDAARSAYGRTVVSDRIALHRAHEQSMATTGGAPTEATRAAALGVTVTELRRREDAIATLSGMRNYDELELAEDHGGHDAAMHGGSAAPEVAAETYARSAAVTRALVSAVVDVRKGARRRHDPLALSAAYLAFWEGLGRAQIARELDVLPRTAAAALSRVLAVLDPAELT